MFTLVKKVRHVWATKLQQWEHKSKSYSPSVPGDLEVSPVWWQWQKSGLRLEYKLLSGRYSKLYWGRERAWRWHPPGKRKGKKRWRLPVSIREQFSILPNAYQTRHLLLRLIFQDKQICLFQICTKSRCCQLAASSLGPGTGKSQYMHAFVRVCMCVCVHVCVHACIEHTILCSICLILQSQVL